jgi:hypothetical protein
MINEAKSFTDSVTKWSIESRKITESGILQRRLDICNVCENKVIQLGLPWCKGKEGCGCCLSLKAYMPTEQCPIGKW